MVGRLVRFDGNQEPMMGVCFIVTDAVLHHRDAEKDDAAPFGPLSGQMITVRRNGTFVVCFDCFVKATATACRQAFLSKCEFCLVVVLFKRLAGLHACTRPRTNALSASHLKSGSEKVLFFAPFFP